MYTWLFPFCPKRCHFLLFEAVFSGTSGPLILVHTFERREFSGLQTETCGLFSGGRGHTGFAAETLEKFGGSKSSVNRSVRHGDKISKDVLVEIMGTPMDNGATLAALARVAPDQQLKAVADVNAGDAPNVRTAIDGSRENETEKQQQSIQRAWDKAGTDAREEFMALNGLVVSKQVCVPDDEDANQPPNAAEESA